jgi:excinuclease ABC subunit C
MADQRLARLLKKARRLPLTPGVYIMKNSAGKIIYIGKAKALKNRVSQYFGTQEHHTEKVRRMVANVEDFEYILCGSEFEALMLECSLIKQHSPKYNILLKDAKGFHYIRVTRPPWTTIKAVKMMSEDGAQYIGPYNSSWTVSQSVDAANRIFRLPQCGKTAKDMGVKKGRPCLNYFIGQCSAPCCGKISQQDYDEAARQAVDFLKNGSTATLGELERQMNDAAERLEFERAARLRDRIGALRKMSEKQKVIETSVRDQDVIAVARAADRACFEVFIVREGRLCDREHFLTDAVEDDASARAEFITRYYSLGREIPPRITVDGEVEDIGLLTEWLSEKRGKKAAVTIPQKGEQLSLVKMCIENAAEYLAEKTGRTGRDTAALDELARLLGLKSAPRKIEAYDISNTAGSENVAGMVVFFDGKPLKSAYRKFKIKGFSGQDDYASMAEVIGRRLEEYKKHGGDGDDFGILPDLILLDGGKGQVSAVLPVLRAAGIELPVFGMVKDDRHRTRAITSDGDEIAVKATRSAYTLVSTIQEEVHRFAVGYHHQRQKKRAFSSSLTEIEGIGPTRAKALLRHFGTIAAISAAEQEDLCKVPGMNSAAAKKVYEYYYQQEP